MAEGDDLNLITEGEAKKIADKPMQRCIELVTYLCGVFADNIFGFHAAKINARRSDIEEGRLFVVLTRDDGEELEIPFRMDEVLNCPCVDIFEKTGLQVRAFLKKVKAKRSKDKKNEIMRRKDGQEDPKTDA